MLHKIRVLVGKPGLDGHDRGAKVVAAALRDAGMEVIYTGLHQSAEQIVEAAVQEDVDVVALSVLSGAHMTLFPQVLDLMRRRGIGDKLLVGGGIIPPEDMETLQRAGVGRLFGPGSSTQDIAVYIREWFMSKHGADSLAPLPPAPVARAPVPTFSAREATHHAVPRPRAAAAPAKPASRPATASRPAARKSSRATARTSSRAAVRRSATPAARAAGRPRAAAKRGAGSAPRSARGGRKR